MLGSVLYKGTSSKCVIGFRSSNFILLSLDTAIVLASDNKFLGIAVTDVVLESVIERSWRAIQK